MTSLALPGLAQAGLVVRSAGPSSSAYPPGRSVADAAPIALKPGDIVTVLVSNATRVLRGPGTFTLGATRVAAAAFNARGRFGAMRSGDIPSSPSLWHVDVSQSGTVCVSPDVGVKLWRPEKDAAVKLAISGPGGAAQSVDWAGGKDELAWPRALPLQDGGEYRLTWTGNDDPTRLKLVKLASVPNDPDGLAKVLIDKGCQSQLDLFIDNIPPAAS
ncbi:hypothetical protein [Sphingosinicella sp. BN140058]|uniref:hypothetical protein n=1 Tax=Sphingosinicella sp. BN140058 TaxID=1892855 RepID=UPI00101078D6|nr:hypothetical protein [Sphingosinicella sp. BN140058]QAY79088.1 hypothetical protein ETR14_23035 [Sphingosinicella sp. BN140058]